MILTRYAGQLKLSKFTPDEFVVVFWRQTVNIGFLLRQHIVVKGGNKQTDPEAQTKTSFAKKQGMSWAQRLKRVFKATTSCSRPLPTSM